LARRDAAIVSETAGTTRDVIEVHLDLGGWPVVLADTAGLRDSADKIEQEGVRRARARAAAADLRLLVLDATGDWQSEGRLLIAGSETWNAATDIVVVNKIDLSPVKAPDAVSLSATMGTGVPELLARLEKSAAALMAEGAGTTPLTRARHRGALHECQESLARALVAPEVALAAEDLRLALRALGRITGTVRVEELLDVIFRDFCIGK
jgi:tRNA modification GTPase